MLLALFQLLGTVQLVPEVRKMTVVCAAAKRGADSTSRKHAENIANRFMDNISPAEHVRSRLDVGYC